MKRLKLLLLLTIQTTLFTQIKPKIPLAISDDFRNTETFIDNQFDSNDGFFPGDLDPNGISQIDPEELVSEEKETLVRPIEDSPPVDVDSNVMIDMNPEELLFEENETIISKVEPAVKEKISELELIPVEPPKIKMKPQKRFQIFSVGDVEETKSKESENEDDSKSDKNISTSTDSKDSIKLQDRFKNLFYLLEENEDIDFSSTPPGITITTDKLVYRPGETILVQAYFYNKYDKSPYPIGSIDTPFKLILRSDSNFYAAIEDNYQVLDNVLMFSVNIPETQAGGEYMVELTKNFEETIQTQTVFIFGVDSPSEMLLLEVEQEEVLLRSKLKAQVSLRVLGRDVGSEVLAKLPVEVKLHSFREEYKTASLETDFVGKTYVEFDIDEKTFDSVDQVELTVSVVFDKKEMTASKTIRITKLKTIECDVTPMNTLFYDKPSKMYVQCFTNSRKQHEYVIKKAKVIKQSRQGSVSSLVVNDVTSDENGLASVSLTMQEKYDYFLIIESGDFTKRVRMPTPSRRFYRGVLLNLNRLVLNQSDTLEISVEVPTKRNDQVFVVLQDKMKVLLQKEIDLKNQTQAELKLPVKEIDFRNGGILSVQLFSSNDEMNNVLEEKIIYVHPERKLEFKVNKNKQIYYPGDEAVFSFETEGENSGDILWQVVVTDESGFLQVDKKKHPPSLITKIFLENDLYFSKENKNSLPLNDRFENSSRYVDWFFRNKDHEERILTGNERALEYLLLNQSERKKFLSPKRLFDFLINKNQHLNSEKKRLYNYLLAGDYSEMSKKFEQMKKNFEEREKISFDRILTLYDVNQAIQNIQSDPVFYDSIRSYDYADSGPGFSDSLMSARSFSASSPRKRRTRASAKRRSSVRTPNNNSPNQSEESLKSILSKDTLIFSTMGTNLSSSKIKFKIPNHVGKFRLEVVGVTKEGVYGTHSSFVQLQKKFNARVSLPRFLRLHDKLKVPLTIENNTE
jgi:hypothetical protein